MPAREVDEWAWIDWEHPRQTELSGTVLVGDRERPEAQAVHNSAGGVSSYDGLVGLDLTTPGARDIQCAWLRTHDSYIPYFGDHLTGWVHDFRIEQPGHEPLVSRDTPAHTLEMDPPSRPPQYLVASRVHPVDVVHERADDSAAALADIDGDGLVDWGLSRNVGDGTFEDWPLAGGADPITSITAVAWGDHDADGDLDPAVA